MDKELTNIVMDTLYHVAMAAAKGESDNCMNELEEAILLLEVATDNAAADQKDTAELEEAKSRLVNLQNTFFEHASD